MQWWEIALIVIGGLAALIYVVIPVVAWVVGFVINILLLVVAGLLFGIVAIGELIKRMFS